MSQMLQMTHFVRNLMRRNNLNFWFLDMLVLKVCPGCKKAVNDPHQIAQEFGLNRARKDGYQVYCKKCRSKK